MAENTTVNGITIRSGVTGAGASLLMDALTTLAARRRTLAHSAVPASVTGTTTETALATVAIPALGENSRILVWTQWSTTNSANNKILRNRLGGASGTQYLALTVTTTASVSDARMIANRGATNSQAGFSGGASGGMGTSTAAITTSAVDTSSPTTLVISGQLANTGETITLESYLVELIP